MRDAMQRFALPIVIACVGLSPAALFAAGKPSEPERLLKLGGGQQRDGMLRFQPVQMQADALEAAAREGGSLSVPDPDGGTLSFDHVAHTRHDDGMLTWIGRTRGAPIGREAVLTTGSGAVFGRLPRPDGSILYLETLAGQTRLMLDDAAATGASSEDLSHDVRRPPLEALRAAGKSRLASTAPVDRSQSELPTVDVMLAYSPGLASYVGGDAAVRVLLQNRIDVGNQALTNGQVQGRYRLVATPRVDINDTEPNSGALDLITNWKGPTASPLALHLAMLRHRHGADLVGLVRRYFNPASASCGNGWVGGYLGSNIANSVDYGYFTASHGTDNGFFCADRTIAHEMGHNLGQNHDIENAENKRDGAHTYSHGYRESPPGLQGFYTVMAYGASGQRPSLTYSNPNVTRSDCANQPCGTAEADVARSLNLTLPVVAGWIKAADGTQRDIAGTRGSFDVPLTGLPALTNARWRAEFTGPGRITVTGPSVAPAGAAISARVNWDALPGFPGTPLAVRVVVESSPGVRAGELNLQLTRREFVPAPRALREGVATQVAVPSWNRTVEESRLYFVAPPHARTVRIRVDAPVDVDIYARAATDVSADSPLIGPGSARGNPLVQDIGSSLSKEIVISPPVGAIPTRYMITLARANSGTLGYATATVTASVTATNPAPAFRSGQYYNPQRSGHGVFVDFADSQWVAVWYTYLEDGTPTWYYAQGPAPAPGGTGTWSAPLLRVGWSGSATHATEVGEIIVTPVSATSMQFSYNLDGDSGSEALVRLGGTGCPSSSGAALDATGHWYSPTQSGFGYSAQYEPDQEIYLSYLYDAAGVARWLIGAKPWNEAATQVNLEQIAGSCPTCGLAATTSRATGQLTRSLGTNADGKRGLAQVGVNATLLAPLSGSWSQSRATEPLSARKNCL
jgi:hypothetical protein